jgi:hypothetical protein
MDLYWGNSFTNGIQRSLLDYNKRWPLVLLLLFSSSNDHAKVQCYSPLVLACKLTQHFGTIRDMKHFRNFSSVIYMEANENYSHTNYFLTPIIPHEHRNRKIQRFVLGKVISLSFKLFNCTFSQILNTYRVVFFLQQWPWKVEIL